MIRLILLLLALAAPGCAWAQSLSCSLDTAIAACRPPLAEGNFKCWKCAVEGRFARYSRVPVACATHPTSGPCQALKKLLAEGERSGRPSNPFVPAFSRGTIITCTIKTQIPICRRPYGQTNVQCWQCVIHHVPPPPPAKCPYDSGGYQDGCDAAPASGQYTAATATPSGGGAANWAAYARQSGQTWASNHPWGWNQPGVDYAIGPYTAQGSLADPATLPTSGAVCVYSATGSPNGGAQVHCTPTSTSSIVDLEGYDFSQHNCTFLRVDSGITAITLKNDYFASGSNCDTANGGLVLLNGGGATLDLESSEFNGAYPAYTPVNAPGGLLIDDRDMAPCGSTTMKYMVFVNSPQRPISATTCGSRTVAYSYFEGWQLDSTFTQHGEVIQDSTPANTTVPSVTYSFNTFLAPSSQPGALNAAIIAVFTTKTPVTYTAVGVDHSIFVTNVNTATAGTSVTRAVWVGYDMFGTVTLNNNYIDPTGMYECFSEENAVSIGSTAFTANLDLLDGSTVTGYVEDGATASSCNGHYVAQ